MDVKETAVLCCIFQSVNLLVKSLGKITNPKAMALLPSYAYSVVQRLCPFA